MTNTLKLDEESKETLLEIGALSGYAQNIVKEVFEYLAYSWAIKIAEKPDEFAELKIPYLGSVFVKYLKDEINKNGELETEIESSVKVNNSFKKLIGDLHDEGYTELVPLMQKKIEQAVAVASSVE